AERSMIAFVRRASVKHSPDNETPPDKKRAPDLIAVVNFTPVPRREYRLGVPAAGRYRELLNSDAEAYGGSNMGNEGGVGAEDIATHNHRYSISLTVPPLGFLLLKPHN
ncbi:MAG: hypothetical protein EXQ54_08125, partial [Acidobacteria bacterium]|nr:hypothetical protein [Acidobacteriota bacterium]